MIQFDLHTPLRQLIELDIAHKDLQHALDVLDIDNDDSEFAFLRMTKRLALLESDIVLLTKQLGLPLEASGA